MDTFHSCTSSILDEVNLYFLARHFDLLFALKKFTPGHYFPRVNIKFTRATSQSLCLHETSATAAITYEKLAKRVSL